MMGLRGGEAGEGGFVRCYRGLVLALVLICISPVTAVELFGPQVGLRTGNAPSHAVCADFDNNGVVDFAVTNLFGGSVSVILGDGLGGFDVMPDVPVPPFVLPSSLAAGDFDLDGNVDLVVVHPLVDLLTVLGGDGKGGFSARSSLPVSGVPAFVVSSDFNFDGAADLAVASSFGDSVTVLLSDREGGFNAMPEISTGMGSEPHFLAVADLDGDGNEDLAVVNAGSDSVTLLIGDGAGGFASAGDLPLGLGMGPTAIAVEDLDLDGELDLAVTNGADDSLQIWLGVGSATFTKSVSISDIGDAPVWVSAGDFDADGDPDLVVTNLFSGTLQIVRGNPEQWGADGGVALPPPIELFARATAVGDFTADGALDLAVVSATQDLVTILPGDGLGGVAPVKRVAPNLGGAQAATGVCVESADIDMDGHADVVVASPAQNAVLFYRGDGDGNFVETSRTEVVAVTCLSTLR